MEAGKTLDLQSVLTNWRPRNLVLVWVLRPENLENQRHISIAKAGRSETQEKPVVVWVWRQEKGQCSYSKMVKQKKSLSLQEDPSFVWPPINWTNPTHIREYYVLCSVYLLKWKCYSLSCVWLFVTPWTVTLLAPLPWNSSGKNNSVGCHCLHQEIFPIQGSNLGLLHYRQILYCLSDQGSPC